MARRAFQGARSPQRRLTAWSVGVGGETQTSIVASANTIIGSGVVLVDDTRVTLVRIRGNMTVFLTGIASLLDGFFWAFGIGLVTDQAFAAGAAAIPDPFDESAWPGWIYHSFGSCFGNVATTIGNEVYATEKREIDSKAMRKWGDGQTLVAMLSTTEVGSATLKVNMDTRLLVKLS